MRIAIGSDHVAVDFKDDLMQYLASKGHQLTDAGPNNTERTDYPIYAMRVTQSVLNGHCDRGILVCGSGVGMSIAANKVPGIRAVVCSEPYSAKLSREHNLTNVLCMGARVIGLEMAKMIVDMWLEADFAGERHQDRLQMLAAIENGSTLIPS